MADFDIDALFIALDTERRARDLSWEKLAREMGGIFGISPSTLSEMRSKRVVEGDGVLGMLRWLGRTPESFVPGHPAPAENEALPEVPKYRFLRFDTKAVYVALDAQRVARGMTWKEVAKEIGGLGAAGLTRLERGGRTAFPEVMRIIGWLGRPAASFTRIADR